MKMMLRGAVVAGLTLAAVLANGTVAGAAIERPTSPRQENVTVAAFPACNKTEAQKGTIIIRGGQRYQCQCRTYIAGQPCQYVWVNLDAKEFRTLELGFQVAIVSRKAFFIFQRDGNLVVYDEFGRARWSARTHGRGATYARFQVDGNLVVYNGANQALWASNTCCASGSKLSIQDDGNVVIYPWYGLPALWATGTNH